MKALLTLLLLALIPASVFAASGTAIPGGNQSTAFLIAKPGAYYLAGNRVMTTKGKPVIEIAASEVTLDLNGFSLSHLDIEGDGLGIRVAGSNVEIRNGSITTVPGYAIETAHTPGIFHMGTRVIDVRVTETKGIRLIFDGTRVERSHVFKSHGIGIYVLGAESVVRDCNVIAVAGGIGLPNSALGICVTGAAIVDGCTVGFTDDAGILATGSCVISNNRVNRSNRSKTATGAGIVAGYGQHIRLTGNTVLSAYAAGIRVAAAAYGSVLEKNVVSSTLEAGPQMGSGIVIASGDTMLRDNLGSDNAGNFIDGAFINAGGNLGN